MVSSRRPFVSGDPTSHDTLLRPTPKYSILHENSSPQMSQLNELSEMAIADTDESTRENVNASTKLNSLFKTRRPSFIMKTSYSPSSSISPNTLTQNLLARRKSSFYEGPISGQSHRQGQMMSNNAPLDIEEEINRTSFGLTADAIEKINDRIIRIEENDPLDFVERMTKQTPLGLRRLDELSGHIHEVMSRLNIESRQPESHVGKNTQTGEDSILGQPRLYFDPRLESDTFLTDIPLIERTSAPPCSLPRVNDGTLDAVPIPHFDSASPSPLPNSVNPKRILLASLLHHPSRLSYKQRWRAHLTRSETQHILSDMFWFALFKTYPKRLTTTPTGTTTTTTTVTQTITTDSPLYMSRAARNYAYTLMTVLTESHGHPNFRDEFFREYPSIISHALISVFLKSFPGSRGVFLVDTFRERICDLVSGLFCGLVPYVPVCKVWGSDDGVSTVVVATTAAMASSPISKSAAANSSVNGSRSGQQNLADNAASAAVAAASDGKKVHARDIKALFDDLEKAMSNAKDGQDNTNIAQKVILGLNRKKDIPSHQSGPGPETKRIWFGIHSNTPLVTEYLQSHNLSANRKPKLRIHRLETLRSTPISTLDSHLPSCPKTYRDLISESSATSKLRMNTYMKSQEIFTRDRLQIIQDLNSTLGDDRFQMLRILKKPQMCKEISDNVVEAFLSRSHNGNNLARRRNRNLMVT